MHVVQPYIKLCWRFVFFAVILLRIAVACELYKREEVSFGKACEIASLDVEKMKEVLQNKGIARKVIASPEDVSNMADEAIRLAGR